MTASTQLKRESLAVSLALWLPHSWTLGDFSALYASSLRWRDCDNVERRQVALISSHAVPLPSLLALYLRRRDRYRSGRHRADARKQQSACMTAQV